jgi:hypothetical protein
MHWEIFIVFIIIFLIWYTNKKSSFTNVQKNLLNYFYTKSKFTYTPGRNLPGIDMVYAISMPSRMDYITKQVNDMNIACKYLTAITPEDLTPEIINKLSNINNPISSIYNKKTRLCVMLSFTMCYMDAIKQGYQTIVVFEDDIIRKVPVETIANGTAEFKNSDIDFLYMGYCFMNCRQRLDKGIYKYMIPLEDPSILCGHATAIKTKVLPKIIEYSFPMTKPSDETYLEYFVKFKSKLAIPKEVYFDQVTRDKMASLNESTNELRYCR